MCPLVATAASHATLHTLRLGRFPAFNDALLTIERSVATSKALTTVQIDAVAVHSKYKPIWTSLQTMLRLRRDDGESAAEVAQSREHVRRCRLKYVAREVARSLVDECTRPASLRYLLERQDMRTQDENASNAVAMNEMMQWDVNVSHGKALLGRRERAKLSTFNST